MNKSNLWNLLWSASQRAFHVETQSETEASGIRGYIDRRPHDYVVLFQGNSHEEVSAFRRTLVDQYGRPE
jgi:hypothetical protein